MSRLEGIQKQREKKLESPPPDIEIVSEMEIYLLDENGERSKRICGKQQRSMPKGYVCLNPAGSGTGHLHTGPCRIHEPKPILHKVSMMRKMRELTPEGKDLFPTISEKLDLIDNTKIEMESLDEEINMMYILLNEVLTQTDEDDQLTPKRRTEALNILKEITKAKEVGIKLKQQIFIDPKTLEVFVKQIFGILKQMPDETMMHRIMDRIYKEVIVPTNLEKQNDFTSNFVKKHTKEADYEDIN